MNLSYNSPNNQQHLKVVKSTENAWKSKTLEKGNVVQNGQALKKIYRLKEGIIVCASNSADGKTVVKNLFYPGDFFGEEVLQVLSGNDNFYQTLTNQALIEEISMFEFQNLTQKNPDFMLFFFQQIMERNKRMEKVMERNVALKSEQRFHEVLKEIILKTGKKMGNGEYVFRHNLQHQEMATIANTTRQMVSSLLSLWRAEGKLSYDRQQIIIRNPQFLI